MSEIKEYHSSFTGPEVDALLTKVKDGSLTAAIEKELAEKADKTGRYPEMSVGFADDLVGRGESVPAEFSFRASGGKSIKDGAARIKRLKGNSVVWNQSCKPFSAAIRKPNNIEESEHGASLTTWGEFDPYVLPASLLSKIGHKCVLTFSYTNTSPSPKFAVEIAETTEMRHYYTSDKESVAIIFDIENSAKTDNINVFSVTDQTGDVAFSNFHLYDLTQMFGAGNEPTTIEEFYARKPLVEDEYAYNEGEVIHMTAEGIKSVGDNAWDEEWEVGRLNTDTGEPTTGDNAIRMANMMRVLPNETYYCKSHVDTWLLFFDSDGNLIKGYSTGIEQYQNANKVQDSSFTTPHNAAYLRAYFNQYLANTTTYNNDIMFTLVHSGWKQDTDAGYQPYWEDRLIFDQRIKDEFPNGMSKWDMVYNKNGKGYIVHGLGVVDLGDLEWYYDASLGGFYSDTLVGANKFFDGICAKYPFVGDYRNVTDKTCGFVYEVCVLVKDSSYTDAASLKASLQGVPLYYELAEPTIIEYDEPFNLDYRVADFGTEQAIAEQPSAPISADIIYQFNAVDMIREHELEIAELQSIIATMQAQLASLMSNNE